jgi:hypothetical protein
MPKHRNPNSSLPRRSTKMSVYCVPHRAQDRPPRKRAVCSHCGTKSKVYTGAFRCERCGRTDNNPVVVWIRYYDDAKARELWLAKFGLYEEWRERKGKAAKSGRKLGEDQKMVTCDRCGAPLLARNSARHTKRCKVDKRPKPKRKSIPT